MTDHEPPPRAERDADTTAALAAAAIFRELDRALDEVRVGLAADAWMRDDGRGGARRGLERS